MDADIARLCAILPDEISAEILGDTVNDVSSLTEIVLDLDREVEFRFRNVTEIVSGFYVSRRLLDDVLTRIGQFGPDNRAGISGSLHRFSRIVDRNNQVVGLTIRVGRPIFGTSALIDDLISEGHSTLLLGSPGKGKTTMLRDVARTLSGNGKRVVIVDTSNEIAGDGQVPHIAVGRSRRLQVPFNKQQADVMIEAVENHTPDVIIIDEISTRLEADACRTISQRGVQLIATAHGRVLEDLVRNPPLTGLIGGIRTTTLGDQEALRRHSQKTVQEREFSPPFNAVIELISFTEVAVHTDIGKSIDIILRGGSAHPERRIMVGNEIRKVETMRYMPAEDDYDALFREKIDEMSNIPTPNRNGVGKRKR